MGEGGGPASEPLVPCHWNSWVVPPHLDQGTRLDVRRSVARMRQEPVVVKKRPKPTPVARTAVNEYLECYEPRTITQANWERVRPFVMSSVKKLDPPSASMARIQTVILTQLAHWCVDQGIALDVEEVLDPDTVERFIRGLDKPVHTVSDYRSRLRRMGPLLTRRAGWVPPPARLGRKSIVAPYPPEAVAQYEWIVAAQHTAYARRVGEGLLVLGLGAGLDGRWNVHVRPSDVEDLGFGLVVKVLRPARRVAVLAEFEFRLRDLVATCDTEFLLCHNRADPRAERLSQLIQVPPGMQRLECNRLRATWLVGHLARSTRLPELLGAAGLEGANTLLDLFPYVTRLPEEEAFRHLRRPLDR